MEVLLINKFLFRKGGDAICTLDTGMLLSQMGHQVAYWGMDHPVNPEYPNRAYFAPYIDYHKPKTLIEKLYAGRDLLYSGSARQRLCNYLKTFKPDIVHLHNFAHQLSPSILDIIKRKNIPMVMTMHDYKMVCASYLMLHAQHPCQACSHGKYYHCLLKKCVRGSRAMSMLNTVEMYLHHRVLHVYDTVDIFISPSMFLKEMLRTMGFRRKIIVIPNFIDTEFYEPLYSNKGYILYFGRLSKEKGLHTLFRALQGSAIEVHIAGSGSCEGELRSLARDLRLDAVQFLGYLSGKPLHNEIVNALCVVLPSEWYENNPRSVLEAFAFGKPVISADIGGIPELVKHDERGLLFTPGDGDQLRSHIEYCVTHPKEAIRMGMNARQYVLDKHNPEDYYDTLMNVYTTLLKG